MNFFANLGFETSKEDILNKLQRFAKIFIWIFLFAVELVLAEDITGGVFSVHDGDTITLQTSSDTKKVRLAGIDAPELKQPYGPESRDALKQDILNQTVTVETSKQDKYGRSVGKLIFNGEDINLKQVSRGMAWVYTDYLKELSKEDQQLYLDAEKSAQKAQVGLWQDESPTAPWTYRKQTREKVLQ